MCVSKELIMFKLIVAAFLVVAAIAAYKLWKSGKAVTGKSVLDGVKTEVSAAVDAVKSQVGKK